MNAPVAQLKSQPGQVEFVLAALRCTILRVKLIESELAAAGTALKGGWITPEAALEWAEEVAPGCVGFIPDAIELSPRRPADDAKTSSAAKWVAA